MEENSGCLSHCLYLLVVLAVDGWVVVSEIL